MRHVKFQPELPSWKLDAIEDMGYGILNKVVLAFDKCCWNKKQQYFGYASKYKGEFYMFVNMYVTKFVVGGAQLGIL